MCAPRSLTYLQGKIYKRDKMLKIHKIENVNVCLRFIQQEGVKGLTVSAEGA